MKLSLRKVSCDDMNVIYQWRMHPTARRMSFNSKSIPLNTHKKWFINKLKSPTTKFYIAVVNKIKVGCIRFEENGETATVDIKVNPDYFNRGIGTAMLKAGIEKFYQEVGKKEITAEILPGNAASIRVFEKCKFKLSHYNYVKGKES